jgi:hypothetical protein
MICPACKQPMIVIELNQVEIDFCYECKGVWLDAGELEILLQDDNETSRLLGRQRENIRSSEKKIHCPICSKKMDKVFMGVNNKIVLDRCIMNHGIWFEKGELIATLEEGSIDKENKVLSYLKEIFKSENK